MGTVTAWGATGVGEWAVSRVPRRKSSMFQWLHSSMLPDEEGDTQREGWVSTKCCQNAENRTTQSGIEQEAHIENIFVQTLCLPFT